MPMRENSEVALPRFKSLPLFLVLVTLGKVLNPFVPKFPHLSSGNMIYPIKFED